jgi:serine/threonine protein kinase
MTPQRWRQIEELYTAVIDLGPAQRSALLAAAAPDIRAEVEAMLTEPASSNLLDRGLFESEIEVPRVPLEPGTLIGQYKIEAQIGEGGMGIVFRAQDTRLHRPVAIKVLSEDFADATARQRLQREAQTASSLNHPHILTVYDVGEFEGREYLVTELIDGGTLKSWAREQPRTWENVVDLLTGVADGLVAAHQAGILHRDIKPANILVTSSGYAKLADFGLAKIEEGLPSPASAVSSLEHTQKGIVAGTIAYMSPEQASGKPLDARSDIFSFGVVLYEMLAGTRPFHGATESERLQQVIHANPAPLGAGVPEDLRAIVHKTLAKDPADRYASMRELVTDLRGTLRPKARRSYTGVAAGAAALLATAIAVFLSSRQTPRAGRLDYIPLTNFTDSAVSPTISPDGQLVAFIRSSNPFQGPGEVYVKQLPDGAPVQLTYDGGQKMGPPSFSADGSQIAYALGNWESWSVPTKGGTPKRLLPNSEGWSWVGGNPRSPRVMYSAETGEAVHMGLYTANEDGSERRTIYLPDGWGMAHRSSLSPDGKSVLVVEMDPRGWLPCRLVPFDGSSAGTRVGPQFSCTFANWTPDGKWMYFSADAGGEYHIWRQRFPDGAPEQVTSGATEEQGVSFAPDGKSFVTSVGESQSILWIHDVAGDRQITSEGYAYLPLFSAGLDRLYYLQRSRLDHRYVSGELWTEDLRTGTKKRLLPDFLLEHYDISPDGKQIVFAAIDPSGHSPLWIARLDGSAPPKRLIDFDCNRAFFITNDDIYFGGGKGAQIYLNTVKSDGSGLRKLLPDSPAYLYGASPDGKWLAAWIGTQIKLYPVAGGDPLPVCDRCGGAGVGDRGVTPPAVSWSHDMKEVYFYTWAHQTFSIALKPGQLLPPTLIDWSRKASTIPGAKLSPRERVFLSANRDVYAYAQVSTHRNIYRISVP